jgi:hypothetical protein
MAIGRNRTTTALITAFALGALVGCQGTQPQVSRAPSDTSILQQARSDDGTCWGSDVLPARMDYETNVIASAEVQVFAVPCPELFSQSFVETLQRALAARGHFASDVTGFVDTNTRSAILTFQQDQGFNSSVLTLESARTLGLLAYDRAEF